MQKLIKLSLNKKTHKYYYLRYLLSLTITLVVVYLLVFRVPTEDEAKFLNFLYSDKLIHFLIFGFLLFVWFLSPFLFKIQNEKRLILLTVLVFVFSVILEFLQLLTLHRTFDVLDIAANLTGVVVSYFVHKYLKIYKLFSFVLQ